MKIDVMEFEKNYTFELGTVSQLCGHNIVKKNYILESLRRYFSTYRYREEKNKWRDNIRIDDELLGRKYFTILSVSGREELLSSLKWSKQSLIVEYIRQLLQCFDCQVHLHMIQDQVEEIYQKLNGDVRGLGDIELSYEIMDVWDMVQKSIIVSCDETTIEDKEDYELVMIFLKLLEEVLKVNPKKTLVLMENLDHFISKEEYFDVINKMKDIGRNYDIYFIVTTSLDGYVVCDQELWTAISVFNDVDFQFPEFDKVFQFIYNSYPFFKEMSDDEVVQDMKKIIHKIGKKDYLVSIEENVICKLMNQSMMIYEKMEKTGNASEIAFLRE